MNKIILDFSNIKCFADFYNQLGQQLSLPNYFGNNLDALWDILTSGYLQMPIEIIFTHFTYQPVYEPLVALFNEAQQQLKGALIFTIITE